METAASRKGAGLFSLALGKAKKTHTPQTRGQPEQEPQRVPEGGQNPPAVIEAPIPGTPAPEAAKPVGQPTEEALRAARRLHEIAEQAEQGQLAGQALAQQLQVVLSQLKVKPALAGTGR